MCLSGFPALRSSYRHGDVSAGPTFCRSSRKVLQIKYHTPESCCWPQTAYCSLNVCLTLAFFKGFKKLPQTAHQHGEGRTGESSPPLSTISCLYLRCFSICPVLFVCLSVQADPLLGLLGFGGGMDFDSDKAYRWYRDVATSSLHLLYYITFNLPVQLVCYVEGDEISKNV